MAKAATMTKDKPATDHVDPETGEVTEGAGPPATTTGGAVASADEYAGYEADAGAGFEGQTAEDYIIPRIRVLHTSSPEVVRCNEEENPPFKGGMIFNSVRQTLYPGKTGMDFIPVLTDHKFVEFVPRNKGGGFVDSYTIDDPLIKRVRNDRDQKFGDWKNPDNGNDLTEFFELFVLEIDGDGAPAPASLGFKSTFIREYREFMTRARNLVITLPNGRKLDRLPLFSHCYHLTTERKQADDLVWWVPHIGFSGETASASRVPPSSDLYKMAREMRDAIISGRLRADDAGLAVEEKVDPSPRKAPTDREAAPY